MWKKHIGLPLVLMTKGKARLTEEWDTPVSNLPLKGSRGQKTKWGPGRVVELGLIGVFLSGVVALASCIFAAAQSLAI